MTTTDPAGADDCETGRGTTLRILFPAAAGTSGVRQRESGAGACLAPTGNVLVVDDEEVVLSVCRSVLERLGFTVLAARGGHRAPEVFGENADGISLVITGPEMQA